MVRLIYFEIRKNFLKKSVLSLLFIFVLFNFFFIYYRYQKGEGAFSEVMNKKFVSTGQWRLYQDFHHRMNGKLTDEKVQFIIDENQRLESIIQNGEYSRQYDEDTYTGYIFGDYTIINQYFYIPIRYSVLYKNSISEIIGPAAENSRFYQEIGNRYEYEKNQFITEQYAGRELLTFYETDSWNLLFQYRYHEMMIMILLLFGLVPIYYMEKETGMQDLILTSREGGKDRKIGKLAAALLFTLFLTILFAGMNYLSFNWIYGLDGNTMPLYAIQQYEYTPVNLTVFQFYLYINLLKLAGFLVIGLVLCVISKIIRNITAGYFSAILFIVLGIYLSGYYSAAGTVNTYLSVLSPFTLLKGAVLYQELLGLPFFGHFFLRGSICILLQSVILIGIIGCFFLRVHFQGGVKRKGGMKIEI